jgi:hypothetical protein
MGMVALSLRIKLASTLEADHSPEFSLEVTKAQSFSSSYTPSWDDADIEEPSLLSKIADTRK